MMPVLFTAALLIGAWTIDVAIGSAPWVTGIMVAGTAIWAAFDARAIDGEPGPTFFKVLVLWVVFFPMYLYERKALREAQALGVSSGVAALKAEEVHAAQHRALAGRQAATLDVSPAPRAGGRTSRRFCSTCGRPVAPAHAFCGECGSALG